MFGFPPTIHQQFKKNFLKTVIFQISYDENSECIIHKDNIIQLFSAKFPRINKKVTKEFQFSIRPNEQTPLLQASSDKEGIEMKSDDGQKTIFINKTSFSLTVSGRGYKSFNELKNEIESINEFFQFCNIKVLKKIAIRKINVFDFELTDNPSEILAHIISPDLLSNINYFPKPEEIKQNIQNVIYAKNDYRLILKYGLNIPPPPNTKLGQVIIDIDLINTSNTPIGMIFEIAVLINQEIFNIFNWSISENTKKLLNV